MREDMHGQLKRETKILIDREPEGWRERESKRQMD